MSKVVNLSHDYNTLYKAPSCQHTHSIGGFEEGSCHESYSHKEMLSTIWGSLQLDPFPVGLLGRKQSWHKA